MMDDQPRRLGIGLGMGIILLPIVFAWLTLRRGYSATTRATAFVWLAVNVAFGVVRVMSGPYQP